MKKSYCFLISAVLFLVGIIIGFLAAPVKGGISCGNNNGNHYAEDHEFDEFGC